MLKIIKIFKIISYLKKGMGAKNISEIEKGLYEFYKMKGLLD